MIMLPFVLVGILIIWNIFWIIWKYNLLISTKNEVANAWNQIDVQLKRRHDLIPNIVGSIKGSMEYEQDTMRQVMEARSAATGAKTIGESALREGELSSALSRLLAVTENYPDLKVNENVQQLMQELTGTENTIGYARQFYNDIATSFNTMQQTFPGSMIANMFAFKPVQLFQLQAAKEREAPAVDLSIRK